MEKVLKRENEYYKTVVTLMGTSTIRTTDEMYRYINSAEMKFGGDIEKLLPIRSSVLATFLSLLSGKVKIEEDPVAKKIGRLIPKLYTLKITVDEACNIIDEYYEHSERVIRNQVENKPQLKIIGKINLNNAGQPVKKEVPVINKPNEVKSRTSLEILRSILSSMMIRHSTELNFIELRSILKEDSYVISKAGLEKLFKDVESSLKVELPYEIGGNGGRSGYSLIIRDPKNYMFLTTKKKPEQEKQPEKKAELYIPVTAKTKQAGEKPVVKIEQPIPDRIRLNDEKSLDKRDLLFIIAGIVEDKADIFDICKTLSGKYKVSIDKLHLIDLVKSEKDFSINQNQIGFTTKDSREAILKKYAPDNIQKHVYARVGMSLEEIQKFIPKVEICSQISQCDNIYKITISESQHDFSMLLKLYQTFRGQDTIIGNSELVSELELQLKVKNGLWNGSNHRYQLENEMIH